MRLPPSLFLADRHRSITQRLGRHRSPRGVARARARRPAASGPVGRLEVQPLLRARLRRTSAGCRNGRNRAAGAVQVSYHGELFLGERWDGGFPFEGACTDRGVGGLGLWYDILHSKILAFSDVYLPAACGFVVPRLRMERVGLWFASEQAFSGFCSLLPRFC